MARVAALMDQQMRGIAPRGFAGQLHGGRAGLAQELLVEAFVVQDPADHAHGQRQVGAGLDRQPAVVVAGRMAGRGGQQGGHHHVAVGVLRARAGFGQLASLALEGVAGLRRCRAYEQAEAGVGPVGFAVRHARQVAQRRGRAHAVALAAVGAVVAEVHGAE
ncbi:hypothetical protein D3C78_1363180 [compost metagenome]